LLGGVYGRNDKELAEQYKHTDSEARLATLRAIAKEIGCTANQLVYAWMLEREKPVIPLSAASSRAQLEENLAALDIKLSREQRERLDNATA
jgi:aryl-alcohol dehydrogenase-like predicted oxidoreductase